MAQPAGLPEKMIAASPQSFTARSWTRGTPLGRRSHPKCVLTTSKARSRPPTRSSLTFVRPPALTWTWTQQTAKQENSSPCQSPSSHKIGVDNSGSTPQRCGERGHPTSRTNQRPADISWRKRTLTRLSRSFANSTGVRANTTRATVPVSDSACKRAKRLKMSGPIRTSVTWKSIHSDASNRYCDVHA